MPGIAVTAQIRPQKTSVSFMAPHRHNFVAERLNCRAAILYSCCLFASESFQVLIRPLCFVQILPVSRYDFRYPNIRRICGVSRSGREMRVSVLLVLVVGLGACCLAEGEGKVEFQVQDETCSDYCAATYPKHTYPEVRSLYTSLFFLVQSRCLLRTAR